LIDELTPYYLYKNELGDNYEVEINGDKLKFLINRDSKGSVVTLWIR
jgi:hypothetical protein